MVVVVQRGIPVGSDRRRIKHDPEINVGDGRVIQI